MSEINPKKVANIKDQAPAMFVRCLLVLSCSCFQTLLCCSVNLSEGLDEVSCFTM